MRRSPAVVLCTTALLFLPACSGMDRPADDGTTGAIPATLPARVAAAEERYWSGQFDDARVVFTKALATARQTADTVAEANILTWLGLTAWKLGEYGEARRLGEMALTLKQVAGLDDLLFKSYNALGLLAWIESRLPDALDLFTKATEAARANGDERALATVSGNLALVNQDLGRLREARTGFETAITGARAAGDVRVEANNQNNLAVLTLLAGDPAAAIEHLEEASRLYRSIGYMTGLQNTLGQFSGAYADLGEPNLALTYLDSALVLARRQGLRQDEASDLELMAGLHRDLGTPARALAVYAQARAINAELGQDYETGSDLRSEAEIHLDVGDLSLARTKIREALRIHRDIGASLEEFLDVVLLAEIEARADRWDTARRQLNGARKLAERLHARSARVALAITEARIAERRGTSRGVLRILQAAEQDFVNARYDAQAEAHALRARAYAQVGLPDQAIVEGRQAVAAVERVRQVLHSGYFRTRYLAREHRVYSDLVRTLLAAGRETEAFQVADAARGRALVEHLSVATGRARGGHDILAEYAEGRELLFRIEELVGRLDELETPVPPERNPAAKAFLLRELQRSRTEYEALRIRVAETDPQGATVLGTRPVILGEVQQALQPDEALLEYLVADEGLVLFVVRRESAQDFTLSVRGPDLAARVRVAREMAARPDDGTGGGARVLARLHRDLISPALHAGALAGVRQLVIVPHRELAYLPFAALLDEERGRYLVEDYSLFSIPNAAALPVLRARDGQSAAKTFPPALGFGPFPDELPGTRVELEAFARALPGARVRLGDQATEQAVREALTTGGPIHLASHAQLNRGAPMFSRIALAGEGSRETANDGRLEVHELLDLTIHSPLVFLSGCETGVGTAGSSAYAAGEDYLMLAQAFLYAGADNVVATLWRVEDRSAADFAEAFYQGLQSVDPPLALARAQRRMLAKPAYRAPFYWAPYRISGSGGGLPISAISAIVSVPPK